MHSAELNVPQNHVYLFKPHVIKKLVKTSCLRKSGFCYNSACGNGDQLSKRGFPKRRNDQ